MEVQQKSCPESSFPSTKPPNSPLNLPILTASARVSFGRIPNPHTTYPTPGMYQSANSEQWAWCWWR